MRMHGLSSNHEEGSEMSCTRERTNILRLDLLLHMRHIGLTEKWVGVALKASLKVSICSDIAPI